MTAKKFLSLVSDYADAFDSWDDRRDDRLTPEQRKVIRSIPDWALNNVKAAVKIGHGDKWGPACCIELLGAEYRAAKDRLGLKGKQGVRIYIFFGYCSS
jgi:hypothetical protein